MNEQLSELIDEAIELLSKAYFLQSISDEEKQIVDKCINLLENI